MLSEVVNLPMDSRKLDNETLSFTKRLFAAIGLIAGLRKPDFQAAGAYVQMRWGDQPWPVRWLRFLAWAVRQTFVEVPIGAASLTIDGPVSQTPMWLVDENPLANHPWNHQKESPFPDTADTVVIGAGFTGGACAYHWARRAPPSRRMVVLEMDDPASGSSGRNEGLVVMGRYFKMVYDTVLKHLHRVRSDLKNEDQQQLARQFAERYCQAAYFNADAIEETIREEGFQCDYVRAGWIQGQEPENLSKLAASIKMAQDTGFTDWTRISPEDAVEKSGMHLECDAGYSQAAASWHPAKWVWCLLTKALQSPAVELFTRTRVTGIEAAENGYQVRTARGTIRASHIIFATESYTAALLSEFHDRLLPIQEQAASGDGGPQNMKPHIGISGNWWFSGRYGDRVLFGSGGSRLPDHEAGRNRPSRYLTNFVAAQLVKSFGPLSAAIEQRMERNGRLHGRRISGRRLHR